MSAGTQNELDRLRADRDSWRELALDRAVSIGQLQAKRDQLSEIIHRLRTLPTTAIESKTSFIARLRQILDEAP